jgi:acyl-CoA dehydrogenase
MIDFSLPPEIAALKEKVEAFVREEVIPLEDDARQDAHGPSDELRRELVARGRRAGLLAPHVGREWGGLGLDHRGKAVVFEAAGYSLLGPLALNISAPDEGNMHLLEQVATEAQKERWLRPLAAGEIRSCFSMTEPGGAGSDPNMLTTTAAQDGGDWVINGRKWFITGALGAGINIVMARTADAIRGGRGATMFLVDMDAPGFRVVRVQDSIDTMFPGGHSEVEFNDVRVPADRVLGAVGEGFRYAQVRLAPARLTHCMRWLGAAKRAHDTAVAHARTREVFGKKLGEHEGVSFMLADNETDLWLARLAIWNTAWALDRGDQARAESSMSKVFVSEATSRVVDRAMQVLGGLGMTGDTVVANIYRNIRPFRIYDGPSEVHRWAIGARLMRSN